MHVYLQWTRGDSVCCLGYFSIFVWVTNHRPSNATTHQTITSDDRYYKMSSAIYEYET
jgi:hypothetical protein